MTIICNNLKQLIACIFHLLTIKNYRVTFSALNHKSYFIINHCIVKSYVYIDNFIIQIMIHINIE